MNIRLSNLLNLLGLAFAIGTALPLAAHAAAKGPNDVTIMSVNCYCFPPTTAKVLDTFSKTNLHSGISQSVAVRIKKIADFILKEKPDIVFFQELWKGWKSGNKRLMYNYLKSEYPFECHNVANEDILLPWQMDDGLMIMARKGFTPVRASFPTVREIVYNDKSGDEEMARKGALIVAFEHNYETLIVADTHLQSGTPIEDVRIKERQIQQLAQQIRELEYFFTPIRGSKPAMVVIGGDFNEPISFIKQKGSIENVLFDRTKWVIDAFNTEFAKSYRGIKFSNNALISRLAQAHGATKVVDVYQLLGKAVAREVPSGKAADASWFNADWMRFNGNASFGWAYMPEGTETSGMQMLDQFFFDETRSKATEFRVLRKEFLGDAGPARPYNGDTAITDHSAVMITLSPVK